MHRFVVSNNAVAICSRLEVKSTCILSSKAGQWRTEHTSIEHFEVAFANFSIGLVRVDAIFTLIDSSNGVGSDAILRRSEMASPPGGVT